VIKIVLRPKALSLKMLIMQAATLQAWVTVAALFAVSGKPASISAAF